jgi:hypothetical protein
MLIRSLYTLGLALALLAALPRIGQATPAVSITATDAEASESIYSGRFTLTRTESTAAALTVNVAVSGTATNGTDYVSIASTQTFPANQSTLIVNVYPEQDTAQEGVETVTLTVTTGTGYVPAAPTAATVNITDNDFTACSSTATKLCLQGGRFEVTLDGTVGSTHYTGQAVPLGTATGAFWLFSSNNLEVAVKVLDGAGINERFWVYHGAATDVAYTLTVKDRANPSRTQTYSKAAGTYCGGNDIGTFLKTAPETQALEFDAAPAVEPLAKSFTCVANSTTTCLLGNRFRVRVKQGSTYRQVFYYTADTGFFWFYSSDNMEIFVKVLDGTAINGKYWMFFGSLTDQAYTIEVTDSTTEILKSYTSPGAMCGNSDTAAF